MATSEEHLAFCLNDADWLGFDLDHTLVRYDLETLLPLIYEALTNHLVATTVGTSVSDARRKAFDVPYNFGFCSRGVLFDFHTGDLVKLDAVGRVRRVCHGYRAHDAARRCGGDGFLEEGDVLARYGSGAWRGFEQLQRSWKADDAVCWVTAFELPAAQICAILVDEKDNEDAAAAAAGRDGEGGCGGGDVARGGRTARWYGEIWQELLGAFNHNLTWTQFAKREGWYFPPLQDAPSKYVRPRPEVAEWLRWLRQEEGAAAEGAAAGEPAAATGGRPARATRQRLFLLTNSSWDYAELLLREAFGEDWRELFDLVVYRGMKKSGFFEHDSDLRPFRVYDARLRREGEEDVAEVGGGCREYVGGNAAALGRYFGAGARVAYFGDDPIGDISVVRRLSSWRTVAVIEELELERRGAPFAASPWGPVFECFADEASSTASTSGVAAASDLCARLTAVSDIVVPDLCVLAEAGSSASEVGGRRFAPGEVFMGV